MAGGGVHEQEPDRYVLAGVVVHAPPNRWFNPTSGLAPCRRLTQYPLADTRAAILIRTSQTQKDWRTMGFVNWFKTTTFYGKLIRDVGAVVVPTSLGATKFRLQELGPSLHTGERLYLLTVSRRVLLSYRGENLKLTHAQVQALRDLFGSGSQPQEQSPQIAAVSPGSPW